MKITYPHTIENCIGEKLIFKSLEGDKLLVENYVKPGAGPIMHTHFKQEEALTVVSGKIGYQLLGEEPKYAGPGETVLFVRGTPHRFWNAGEDILHCTGYIHPANTIVYYLSAIFAAQNKTNSERPEMFDSAYLLTRYASEYDLPEMPKFVKKVILPLTVSVGKVLGKYKHFEDAPEAV